MDSSQSTTCIKNPSGDLSQALNQSKRLINLPSSPQLVLKINKNKWKKLLFLLGRGRIWINATLIKLIDKDKYFKLFINLFYT